MSIKCLNCRTDINFEVDYGPNPLVRLRPGYLILPAVHSIIITESSIPPNVNVEVHTFQSICDAP